MAEEPIKTANYRDPKTGQFLQGNHASPGRPKKKGSIIEILEAMIEERAPGSDQTIKEVIARTMLLSILDRKDKNYAEMLKETLNRLYGKPKESIELSGNAEKPIAIRIVDDNGG